MQKTILVDAINTFIIPNEGINEKMHRLLDKYPNRKIILTNATNEKMEEVGLNRAPYEVFSLRSDPPKTNPDYYRIMLTHFNLNPENVVYFEHDKEAVESARSVGIKTQHYDKNTRDLENLKRFLDENLQ